MSIFEYGQGFSLNFFEKTLKKKQKILVCGGYWDGRLVLISTENDNIIEVYNQHVEAITVIEEDSKENFLITGSKNGECIYWRITPEYKLQVKYIFYDHDDEVKTKSSYFLF